MTIISANNGNESQKWTFHLLFNLIIIIFTQTSHTFCAHNYGDSYMFSTLNITADTFKYLDDIYKEEPPRLWTLYSNIFTDVLFTYFRKEIEAEFTNYPEGANSPLLTFLNDLGFIPESFRKIRANFPFKKLKLAWDNFKFRFNKPSQYQVPPQPDMVTVPKELKTLLGMQEQKFSVISYNELKKRFLFYVSTYNPSDTHRNVPFYFSRGLAVTPKRVALIKALYYLLVLDPFFHVVQDFLLSNAAVEVTTPEVLTVEPDDAVDYTPNNDWDHPDFDPIAALGLPVTNIEKVTASTKSTVDIDFDGLKDLLGLSDSDNAEIFNDWINSLDQDSVEPAQKSPDKRKDYPGLGDSDNAEIFDDWINSLDQDLSVKPARKPPEKRKEIDASTTENGFNDFPSLSDSDNAEIFNDWINSLDQDLNVEPAQKKPRLRNFENAKKVSNIAKSGNGFNIGGPLTMIMGMVIVSISGLIIYAIFSVVNEQRYFSTTLTDDSETMATTTNPDVSVV